LNGWLRKDRDALALRAQIEAAAAAWQAEPGLEIRAQLLWGEERLLAAIGEIGRSGVSPDDVAQPQAVRAFVGPTHRLVKARKVRNAHRRLHARLAAYHAGDISFAELDAGIRGWIAHVGHADSWGLRERVLESLAIRPAEHRRALAARGA
jgi:hypothetical protein